MADGFARATGRPAACIVVPGPGLTNVMTALGQAYLDSVPVLAIAGQNPIPTLGRRLEEFHELHNSLQVAGSVTASARLLTNPADAPAVIRDAVRLMRSGHPRPTYVEVPLDVAGAEAEVEMLPPAEDFPRPSGDPRHKRAERLNKARAHHPGRRWRRRARPAPPCSAWPHAGRPIIMSRSGVEPSRRQRFRLRDAGAIATFDDLFAEAATLIVGTSPDPVMMRYGREAARARRPNRH
jgi:hypothetical protein